MIVLVSGASGFIGSALTRNLESTGHQVLRLVRARPAAGARETYWDPAAGAIEVGRLDRVDAVVHLAATSVAGGPWTPARKARIRDSRVAGTRLLAMTLATLDPRPATLVCASAVGYYGHRGDETLTEESGPGTGFFPETCLQWEAAAEPAKRAGIRVVQLRFGVVLGVGGGALAAMLPMFRLGLGARLAGGEQYMSWIALDDAIGAIRHALETETLVGPANATSPNPVTNREFTETLGRILGRPTLLAVPRFLLRLAPGDMADQALLASARVVPSRLLASGYRFRFPDLEPALRHILIERAIRSGG